MIDTIPKDDTKEVLPEPSPEIHKLVTTMREHMNKLFEEVGSPLLTSSVKEYDRAVIFNEFNNWLKTTEEYNIKRIAAEYGILPISFLLSGINVDAVALLQNNPKIDIFGYVRYISIVLRLSTNNSKEQLTMLIHLLFGTSISINEEDLSVQDLRSVFVSNIVGYFINTSSKITYEQSMARVLNLLPVT